MGLKLEDPIKDASKIIVFEQKEWSAPSTENPSFVSRPATNKQAKREAERNVQHLDP